MKLKSNSAPYSTGSDVTKRVSVIQSSERRPMMNALLAPRTTIVFTIVFSTLFCTHAACAQTYSITEIGTLGGPSSGAHGINNAGVIVGSASINQTNSHAVAVTNGVLKDLGTLGGLTSAANDINENDQIVGASNPAGSAAHRAFLYAGGSMQDLGALLTGSTNSEAYGINNLGAVVGEFHTPAGNQRPFLFSGGSAQDLGFDGVANDINDSGQIVGFERTGSGNSGFIITGGQKQYVGTLGGNDTSAIGINNNGQVVGNSLTASGTYHAFIYQAGNIRDLGTLGGASSEAYGINNQGMIVGQAKDNQGNGRAYVYRNGVMLDLNNFIPVGLGWVLDIAYRVNDSGQIVGSGTHNGQTRGFLLTPANDLTIAIYPGLTIQGQVGRNYRIDYLDAITATNTWQVLTNLALPTSPYLFIDPRPVSDKRFYRSVLLP